MNIVRALPVSEPGMVFEAELPSTVRVVLAGITREGPRIFLEFDEAAPVVKRAFVCLTSGRLIPSNYTHFSSFMIGPTDFHVYEVAGPRIVIAQA